MPLLTEILSSILSEKMTFSQLFNSSDRARKNRAKDVRVTKLPVLSSRRGIYWDFRYKSNPSSTGERYRGRIIFRKTTKSNNADDLPCLVDCSCPDYKYRWAYANDKKEAGVLGPNSLNQANGAAPDPQAPPHMNPRAKPGLCKHLLALKTALHQKLNSSPKRSIREKLDDVVDRSPRFDVDVEE